MSDFQPVARAGDIHPDLPFGAQRGDRKLVLLRDGERIRAFDGECPHAKGPLAKGAICDGALICPLHKARFATATGAVLDPPALSPLNQYPVRIEDGEVLVGESPIAPAPATAAPATSPSGPDLHFVLAGAGTAALTAAQRLREEGFAGRITMIGPEPTPPYDRTALSKTILGGDKTLDELPLLRPADFFDDQRIERLTDSIVRLDPETRRITLASGRTLAYDAALVATGATPRPFDAPGADLPGVHTLRTPEDAANILAELDGEPEVAIVGGGFIALEAAASLRKRGLAVTLVIDTPIPFGTRFGEPIGKGIRALLEDKGVRFAVGKARAIRGEAGRVSGVELDDGSAVPAGLVLVAAGVRPNTGFVSGVAHAEDGGIVVDRTLRAAPGLYAAGDVATAPLAAGGSARIEHWRVAEQHGRLAALNMLGREQPLDLVPFFWTFIAGKRFEYLGHAEEWDDLVVEGAPEKADFIAFAVRQGEVGAVIAAGRDTATARLLPHMNDGLGLAAAQRIIAGRTPP